MEIDKGQVGHAMCARARTGDRQGPGGARHVRKSTGWRPGGAHDVRESTDWRPGGAHDVRESMDWRQTGARFRRSDSRK